VKTMGAGRYLGYMLLVTSILTYLILGYFILSCRDVYDDHVTWFHAYVVNSITSGVDLRNNLELRLNEGRDLFDSPILLDFFIAFTRVPMGVWTLMAGVVYLIIVFTATYLMMRDLIIAGFASQLLAVTPCFIYWFKYNMYGSYTIQFVTLLALLLVSLGIARNSKITSVAGTLLGLIAWFLSADGWIFPMIYSVVLLILLFKDLAYRIYLLPPMIFIAFSLPINLMTGLHYITIYHGYAYTALVLTTAFCSILGRVKAYLDKGSLLVLKVLTIIATIPLTYYATLLVAAFTGFPGKFESYAFRYNPLTNYGVLGLLSIVVLVDVARMRPAEYSGLRFFETTLFTGFILSVLLAYGLSTLSVLAAAFISPLASRALLRVASTLYGYRGTSYRALYAAIAVGAVISSILASTALSYSVASAKPQIYYIDIPRESVQKVFVEDSSFLRALATIRDGERKLVISYWGYSYWIHGYLGSNTYTLADPDGPREAWRLISWIFMSDEETAYSLIKSIAHAKNITKVYIVVSEAVTIEQAGESKTAYLGAVVLLPPTIPGAMPIRSYQPLGDLARITNYIELGGLNVSRFLTFTARYSHETPLSWRYEALNTLIVKLVVKGINALGYDAINAVYSSYPITVTSLRYFKLVNATYTPVYSVSGYGYSFVIYSYTAIYEVNLSPD